MCNLTYIFFVQFYIFCMCNVTCLGKITSKKVILHPSNYYPSNIKLCFTVQRIRLYYAFFEFPWIIYRKILYFVLLVYISKILKHDIFNTELEKIMVMLIPVDKWTAGWPVQVHFRIPDYFPIFSEPQMIGISYPKNDCYSKLVLKS